jgi:hypothetical protein
MAIAYATIYQSSSNEKKPVYLVPSIGASLEISPVKLNVFRFKV